MWRGFPWCRGVSLMGSALVCAIGLVVRAACLVWPSGVWVPVRSMAVPGSSRWVSAWWHWEDTMYFGWVSSVAPLGSKGIYRLSGGGFYLQDSKKIVRSFYWSNSIWGLFLHVLESTGMRNAGEPCAGGLLWGTLARAISLGQTIHLSPGRGRVLWGDLCRGRFRSCGGL